MKAANFFTVVAFLTVERLPLNVSDFTKPHFYRL